MSNQYNPYDRWEYTILPYTYREHVLPKELMLDYDSYILYLRNQEDTANIQLIFREFEAHPKLQDNPHNISNITIGLENIKLNKEQLSLEEFKNHLKAPNPHKLDKVRLGIDKLKNYPPATIRMVDDESEEAYMTAEQLKYYLDLYKFKLKNYKQLILDVVPKISYVKLLDRDKWKYGTYHNILIDYDYEYEVSYPGYYDYKGKVSIKDNFTEYVVLKKFVTTETLNRVPSIAISNVGCFGLGKTDNIVSWGDNSTVLVNNTPPGTNFTQIYSNNTVAVAVTKTNSLFTWGDPTSPLIEKGPKDLTVNRLSINDNNCAVITWDGKIEVWGDESSDVFTKKPDLGIYKEISMGLDHCAVIKEDGSLYVWGNNERNQLDNYPRGNDFVHVSCGDYHTIALKKDGSIVGWGDNSFNQLDGIPYTTGNIYINANKNNSFYIDDKGGIESFKKSIKLNTNRPIDKSFIQIIVKDNICVGLRYDGTVATWSDNLDNIIVKNTPTERVFKGI